ncbi:hypothetical protein R6Q57_008544 [Mikania cordata]
MAHSGQHPRPLILFFKETTSLESTGDDEPPPAVIFSPEIDGSNGRWLFPPFLLPQPCALVTRFYRRLIRISYSDLIGCG